MPVLINLLLSSSVSRLLIYISLSSSPPKHRVVLSDKTDRQHTMHNIMSHMHWSAACGHYKCRVQCTAIHLLPPPLKECLNGWRFGSAGICFVVLVLTGVIPPSAAASVVRFLWLCMFIGCVNIPGGRLLANKINKTDRHWKWYLAGSAIFFRTLHRHAWRCKLFNCSCKLNHTAISHG